MYERMHSLMVVKTEGQGGGEDGCDDKELPLEWT